MLDSAPRSLLVDPAFRPPDRHGRFELALVLWLETALERFEKVCFWFGARPLTTFTLWSLWLSALYFALGPASYVKVPDCGNGTLPARMVAANDLLHGRLGYWMDFSGCGTDRVLNNFRLEPLCVLLALLPPWLGYGLIMLVQRFIAGYFFYRVTRDDLKFAGPAAILTGLSYSLFNQLGIHWQWDGFTLYDGLGIPGLPLLFWLANRLVERRWWQAMPGGFAMGVMLALSAPYFQTLFFPFLAIFWYTCIERAWTWKLLALLTCVFAGWAVVMMPEMLAAAQYVPLSHRMEIVVRSDSPYVKYIENVQHWPHTVWLSNRYYVFIALVGLACSRLREPRVIFACLAVAGILNFVSHYHYFNDHFLSHLGILSSFHFHRFIYLVPFLCSLALGLGLTALPVDTVFTLTNRLTGLRFNVHQLAIIGMTMLVLWTSTDANLDRWKQLLRGENYTSLYRHPDLLKLAERRGSEPDFRVACVTDMWRPKLGMSESHRWSPGPGVMWAYGLETSDGYQVLYSLRYKQFWSQVLVPLMGQDKLRMRQHIYWGNMLFLWHPTEEEMLRPTREYFNLNMVSLANTKYLVSPVPLDDPNLELLPSENRDNFIEWDKRGSTARLLGALRGEWSFRPLWIYQNRACLPRFFLAKHVTVYDDADSLVFELRHRPSKWLRDNAQVNRQDLPADVDLTELTDNRVTTCSEPGEVTVELRESDRIELEFNTDQPCLLYLANAFNPAWQAELDGKSVAVFPANHAFEGIFIPVAGKHRVVLNYHAPYAISSAK